MQADSTKYPTSSKTKEKKDIKKGKNIIKRIRFINTRQKQYESRIDALESDISSLISEKLQLELKYEELKNRGFESSSQINNPQIVTLNKDQLWKIESLFGIKLDEEFLTPDFVENLFKNADFTFYQNADKTILSSQKNELLEHDFGQLEEISALNAYQQYGIDTLEEAKEKVYVKLK